MSFVKLRPNQQKGFDDIQALIRSGKRRVAAIAPAGYGKTTLFSAIIASAVSKGKRVAVAIHKKELVFNAVDRLKEQFGVEAGVILSGHPMNKKAMVQIGSIQTMVRRDLSWFNPDLYMVDEGHRLLTNTHLKMYDEWVCPDKSERAVPMIIWTATLMRTDKKRKFSDYIDAAIQLSTYRVEMENKNLVPTKVYQPKETASMNGVKIRMSFGEKDFDQKEMSERFTDDRIIESLFFRWKQYTGGRMQTLIFNCDKRHNKAVYDYFKSKGISCEYVDESTPANQRDEIVKRFKKGPFCDNPITVLMNVGLFSEGLDNSYLLCVVLNYSTLSFVKYVQTTCRGSRPAWEKDYSDWLKIDGKYYKKEVIILDFGGNTMRHGMIEDNDAFGFSLDEQREAGVAPTKACPECSKVVYASIMECDNCGYVFPKPDKKDDKVYSDEVEWGIVDKDQSLVKKIINLKAKQAERSETQWLRIVALIRRENDAWVWKQLESRGEYQQQGVFEWGNKPGSWKEYLENLEKEKGTFPIYERLKSKRLSI